MTKEAQRITKHFTEVLNQTNAIASPYGLTAEIFEDIFSVGVGGDERTYLPVLCLVGQFIGWEKMAEVATEICNILPVNRVVYDLSGLPEYRVD